MNLVYKSQEFDKDAASEGIIKGYASIFGNIDSDGDVMDRGAYTKTLQESKERVKFLWQHDMGMPLGKVMDVYEDEKGLPFEAKISDTELGRDAKTLISDGVLNEFSVGFMPIKVEKGSDGYNHIKEVKLFEFSLVTLAANSEAIMTDYKTAIKAEEVEGRIDAIIKINKSLRTNQAKHAVEFELLKLKNQISLSLFNEESTNTHSDEKEAEEILKAIDELSNRFRI